MHVASTPPPFSVKYPALYNLVKKKNLSVAQVLSMTPLNVSFRRALVGVNWDNWFNLVGSVLEVNLSNLRDTFCWTTSKKVSVKDLYDKFGHEIRNAGRVWGLEG
jgi:hypothetical protein